MAHEMDDATIAFAGRVFDLARGGHAAELADLLDGGLPPNLTNDKGDTLLILAAYYDRAETVQLLLDHGADTNRVNDKGQTALAAAVFRRSQPVVAALLAAGADPAEGAPSAHETARFFDHQDMAALLGTPPA